jgi:hypothetical protein
MTNDELQELSRLAAGCLPKKWYPTYRDQTHLGICGTRTVLVEKWAGWRNERQLVWLYESTEACTEIMVRVLWDSGVHIEGCAGGCCAYENQIFIVGSKEKQLAKFTFADDNHQMDCYASDAKCNNDPMLAFRVAVLRALIALKDGEGGA